MWSFCVCDSWRCVILFSISSNKTGSMWRLQCKTLRFCEKKHHRHTAILLLFSFGKFSAKWDPQFSRLNDSNLNAAPMSSICHPSSTQFFYSVWSQNGMRTTLIFIHCLYMVPILHDCPLFLQIYWLNTRNPWTWKSHKHWHLMIEHEYSQRPRKASSSRHQSQMKKDKSIIYIFFSPLLGSVISYDGNYLRGISLKCRFIEFSAQFFFIISFPFSFHFRTNCSRFYDSIISNKCLCEKL